MQPSPLDLVYYYFTEINITPEAKFTPQTSEALHPNFEDADFSAKIKVLTPFGESDPHEFMLGLQLTGSPKAEHQFPYHFVVGTQGIIRYTGNKPLELDDRKELVVINGAAMLYGAIRELLLGITSRFQHGPIMLPTVNFIDLRRPKSASEPKENINKSTEEPTRKPRAKKIKTEKKSS